MFGLLLFIAVAYYLSTVVHYLITSDIKFYEISNDVAILSIYDSKSEQLSCLAIKRDPTSVTIGLPKVAYRLTGSKIPCITALVLKN